MECFVDITQKTCTKFDSLPAAFYWAVTTLTTVGYGDLEPVTSCGQFVACFAMVSGILVIAMPVTVLSNNFSELWKEGQENRANELIARRIATGAQDPHHH